MKKILRKIANKFGYDFIKINVHSADKAHKISNVKVGNYNILMPGNNPQISLYKYYPTSNTQLARLTEIILKNNDRRGCQCRRYYCCSKNKN